MRSSYLHVHVDKHYIVLHIWFDKFAFKCFQHMHTVDYTSTYLITFSVFLDAVNVSSYQWKNTWKHRTTPLQYDGHISSNGNNVFGKSLCITKGRVISTTIINGEAKYRKWKKMIHI